MKTNPSRYALDLLERHVVNEFPVCPSAIAAVEGILCQPMPSSSGGVSGMLLKYSESYGILYATHIENRPFQRFSIAHELGHLFLPGHAEELTAQGPHASRAEFETDSELEREADLFAATLLMPNFLFDRALDRYGTSLVGVKSLASHCETSLTATAIQCILRTTDVAAMVMSCKGIIEYAFLSDSLAEYPERKWPKRGQAVPRETLTFRVSKPESDSVDVQEGISEFQDWFEGSVQGTVLEEVKTLGDYGKTLTFITVDELPTLEEIEENESLTESWTPTLGKR